MKKKWLYGDSWEKYPIEKNETWEDMQTGSKIAVNDLTINMPDFMMNPDMIYCDPPWNQGNVNSFYTKAGKINYINDFNEFYTHLFGYIKKSKPKCCYLEIGKQSKDIFQNELLKIYPSLQFWQITYYKKHPCFLLRASNLSYQPFDFNGKDDIETPYLAIQEEKPESVTDPCTGQGLTAIAAYKSCVKFFGTELNKRRLAVTIDRIKKLGGKYENTTT